MIRRGDPQVGDCSSPLLNSLTLSRHNFLQSSRQCWSLSQVTIVDQNIFSSLGYHAQESPLQASRNHNSNYNNMTPLTTIQAERLRIAADIRLRREIRREDKSLRRLLGHVSILEELDEHQLLEEERQVEEEVLRREKKRSMDSLDLAELTEHVEEVQPPAPGLVERYEDDESSEESSDDDDEWNDGDDGEDNGELADLVRVVSHLSMHDVEFVEEKKSKNDFRWHGTVSEDIAAKPEDERRRAPLESVVEVRECEDD